MADSIFFSVVIPTYNRADSIAKTIGSFLNQDYQHFEIVVIDDGGSDNTKEVVGSIGDPRISYHWKTNAERAAARNYGAKLAKGDYVTFYDSDDAVYPFYFSHAAYQLDRLQRPECYAQRFELQWSFPDPYPPTPVFQPVTILINKRLTVENNLACNGVFVRRDILDKYDFPDNRHMSGSEDWALWLRLAANFPFHYSEQTCSCLINHDERGELNIIAPKMIKRVRILLDLIRTDPAIGRSGRGNVKRTLAAAYLFAALKLADFTKYKLRSAVYFAKAFLMRPQLVTVKNFYVTIKKLIFSWNRATTPCR